MKVFMATGLVLISQMAAAAQKFSGSGEAYSPKGDLIETFTESVTVEDLGGGAAKSEVEIRTSKGESKRHSVTITRQGKHFTAEADFGKGGGACYGAGVCESYIDSGNGTAFATTVIEDSAGSRRNLTIELRNGKAVRMIRDILTPIN